MLAYIIWRQQSSGHLVHSVIVMNLLSLQRTRCLGHRPRPSPSFLPPEVRSPSLATLHYHHTLLPEVSPSGSFFDGQQSGFAKKCCTIASAGAATTTILCANIVGPNHQISIRRPQVVCSHFKRPEHKSTYTQEVDMSMLSITNHRYQNDPMSRDGSCSTEKYAYHTKGKECNRQVTIEIRIACTCTNQ